MFQMKDQKSTTAATAAAEIATVQVNNENIHCHQYDKFIEESDARHEDTKKLKITIGICLTFMILQIVGGYLANSLAIISDAFHLLSDFFGFLISLTAIKLASRKATKKLNFGYYRFEVLGALISISIVWFLTVTLIYSSITRILTQQFEIISNYMLIVAIIGVFMNLIMMFILHSSCNHMTSHHHGHSHNSKTSTTKQNINIKAAFIHVIGDIFQSVGAVIAALIIMFFPEYKIADPICTIIFSMLSFFITLPVVQDIFNIVMESCPRDVNYDELMTMFKQIPSVHDVHDLHVWYFSASKYALNVHVVIDSTLNLQYVLNECHKNIRNYNKLIEITTIQIELYDKQMELCPKCWCKLK